MVRKAVEDRRYLDDGATYTPQGAALALFHMRYPEVLIEGPAGTGKTRAVVEYLWWLAEHYPGGRYLLARETRRSMTESVLVTLENKVWRGFHPAMHGSASRGHRDSYVFPYAEAYTEGRLYRGRTEWIICGLENTDRIMSTEYDVAAIFEATETKLESFEKVGSRLRNNHLPFQQIIADCNPAHPGHWLNQRAKTHMARLLSRHVDNPSLRPEYLERLSKLTGARRGRYYLGEWVAQEGAVWDEWDATKHMVLWDQLPTRGSLLDFTLYWGAIDWGYSDPGVFQVWAADEVGRAYRLHEVYHTRKNPDWWAAQVEQFCKMYPLRAIIADPSRPDTIDKFNDHLGRYRQRDTERLVREADNEIDAGIGVVRTFLQPQSDGLPGCFLVRDALVEADQVLVDSKAPLCTEDEIPSYHYPTREEGKVYKDKPASGQPDHGCDAMRYALMWFWKRDPARKRGQPTCDPGTYGRLLEHDKFLRRIQRRERGLPC